MYYGLELINGLQESYMELCGLKLYQGMYPNFNIYYRLVCPSHNQYTSSKVVH